MITRVCDCCNQPMSQNIKKSQAAVTSPSGEHLANIVLTMNTRTGAEHVCSDCQIRAVTELRQLSSRINGSAT